MIGIGIPQREIGKGRSGAPVEAALTRRWTARRSQPATNGGQQARTGPVALKRMGGGQPGGQGVPVGSNGAGGIPSPRIARRAEPVKRIEYQFH